MVLTDAAARVVAALPAVNELLLVPGLDGVYVAYTVPLT